MRDLTISTLHAQYRDGSLTPRSLVADLKNAIKAGDSKIWISISPDELLERHLDNLESHSPDDLPLFGIPFAIKDNIDLEGVPTTAGCPGYAYVPTDNAFVVEQLITAGAIPMGKTNLDQFATGLVGVRSPYGFPANPFNPDYIPGGSSSGSAVAVASGLATFSLGTDTAGSGRIPAGLNNLVGVKPSRGLLSCSGVVPACRTLDCVSIFALDGEDAETVLNVAAVFDPEDAYAREVPDRVTTLIGKEFTFGVPKPEQLEFFGDDEATALFAESVIRLKALGGVAHEIDFAPFREAALLLYEGPWVAERFVAIEEILSERPDILHSVTRSIIEGGGKPSAADAFKAEYRLMELKRLADAELGKVDLIVTPTAGTAYTASEVEADPIRLNSNLGYYTNFMNLLDYSACAVPAGRLVSRGNLPWGITLFGPAFDDAALLSVAQRLETGEVVGAECGWTQVVVCGAHMKGLPLNHQLTDRGGKFVTTATTSPNYRFYALPPVGNIPPRPGLIRAPGDADATAVDVEVWMLPTIHLGSFVEGIPSPLGIGKVELDDGSMVTGFICEPFAIEQAEEITAMKSWRRFMDSRG